MYVLINYVITDYRWLGNKSNHADDPEIEKQESRIYVTYRVNMVVSG